MGDKKAAAMKFQADKHAKMVTRMMKGGTTIAQIMVQFGISKRTAYRWIEYAEASGYDTVKRGSGVKTTYHIDTGD